MTVCKLLSADVTKRVVTESCHHGRVKTQPRDTATAAADGGAALDGEVIDELFVIMFDLLWHADEDIDSIESQGDQIPFGLRGHGKIVE